MAADVIKFVDSIAASPTTLLDVNADLNPWICRSITADPPRLRRAMSSNAMRDGVFVSSSQYDARTVVLELECLSNTQDLGATQLQTLARTLDRSDVFLMWQPNSLTKPVFFKLYRSDMSAIRDIQTSAKAYRAVTVELLAEPFALGLRETLGPYTVNNDPAAGSNGCYFDVTGVIGDVATPCILLNTSGLAGGIFATRARGVPSDLVHYIQAESCTLGTDTTNPGGGPDAVMSGTGTNNYVRTSFATATMQTRITWANGSQTVDQRKAIRGTHRLYAIVRRSDSTSVITAHCSNSTASGETVTIPAISNRQIVHLGTISFGGGRANIGVAADSNPVSLGGIAIQAARTSGAGTLDWDAVLLIPADERLLTWESSITSAGFDMVVDGYNEDVRHYGDGADIFAGTGNASEPHLAASGGFLSLTPNQTNRLFHVGGVQTAGYLTVDNTVSSSWTVYYWPRYLAIRPSAT